MFSVPLSIRTPPPHWERCLHSPAHPAPPSTAAWERTAGAVAEISGLLWPQSPPITERRPGTLGSLLYVLTLNPHHTQSQVLLSSHYMDGETEAQKTSKFQTSPTSKQQRWASTLGRLVTARLLPTRHMTSEEGKGEPRGCLPSQHWPAAHISHAPSWERRKSSSSFSVVWSTFSCVTCSPSTVDLQRSARFVPAAEFEQLNRLSIGRKGPC